MPGCPQSPPTTSTLTPPPTLARTTPAPPRSPEHPARARSPWPGSSSTTTPSPNLTHPPYPPRRTRSPQNRPQPQPSPTRPSPRRHLHNHRDPSQRPSPWDVFHRPVLAGAGEGGRFPVDKFGPPWSGRPARLDQGCAGPLAIRSARPVRRAKPPPARGPTPPLLSSGSRGTWKGTWFLVDNPCPPREPLRSRGPGARGREWSPCPRRVAWRAGRGVVEGGVLTCAAAPGRPDKVDMSGREDLAVRWRSPKLWSSSRLMSGRNVHV